MINLQNEYIMCTIFNNLYGLYLSIMYKLNVNEIFLAV